jgi:hypothetical protein
VKVSAVMIILLPSINSIGSMWTKVYRLAMERQEGSVLPGSENCFATKFTPKKKERHSNLFAIHDKLCLL